MTATPSPLIVRKHVRAARNRVFDAWTDPEQLVHWWGPPGIECTHAEIDLRVGGMFRIANRTPDGQTMWIAGVYEAITRPERLQHTWFIESTNLPVPERVVVEFHEAGDGTDIVITHEGIPTEPLRQGHGEGWMGCLDGLVEALEGTSA